MPSLSACAILHLARDGASCKPVGMRIIQIALALLLLSGCQLLDQRTIARWFGGHAVAPSQTDLAAATLPALPLVTIRFDQPDTDTTAVLAKAAEDALERKPTAVFDVVTPLPIDASRAEQDEFVRRGAEDARAVADALATAGVPPEQLRLSLRSDPGNPPREVRVYVR
jgi:hypothetical protein